MYLTFYTHKVLHKVIMTRFAVTGEKVLLIYTCTCRILALIFKYHFAIQVCRLHKSCTVSLKSVQRLTQSQTLNQDNLINIICRLHRFKLKAAQL